MPEKTHPMDTPEQIAAELAASQVVVKEDEVRAAVIAEYGFDEVDDADRIDKLVADKVDSQKKLATAIGQKIRHRTEAEALKNDPRLKDPVPPPVEQKPAASEDIGKVVSEQLEKRDLDALEYSDDLKKEIQRIAQVQNIPIKQALRDPYIVFQIGEEEKAAKTEASSISRNNRSAGKKAYSLDNPPQVDMATEAGRKAWDAFKESLKQQGM